MTQTTPLTPQERKTLEKIRANSGTAREYVSGRVAAGYEVVNLRHFARFKRLGLVGNYTWEDGLRVYRLTERGEQEAGR